MYSKNYMTIRNAIQNKLIITCIYDQKIRKLCPYVIGLENGEEKAFFCQFDGEDSHGHVSFPKWKCFYINKIKDIIVSEGKWHTVENSPHLKPQTCIKQENIDIEVKL